jgi:predicted permease
VLFGLWPALRASRAQPVESLKARGGEAAARRRVSARDVLVVAQVAGSLVLLVAAGLFLRSLANARAIDMGFDPEGALVFSVDLGASGYDAARGARFYTALQERLEHVPGVEAVGFSSLLPLSLDAERRGLRIEGYTPGPGEDMEVHSSFVGPGYFEAMRGRIARGREFEAQDTPEAPGAVIVNEAFVRRYWPGRDGLGERIVTWDQERQVERPFSVVGVARDGKYVSLGEDPKPYVFYPQRQLYRSELAVVVRAQGDPKALAASLRREVKALDATLPVYDVKTLTEHLGAALFPARAAASLVGLSGSLALLLAAIGLYGIVSFTVAARAREIGIRVAVGARPAGIAWLMLRETVAVVAVGVAVGVPVALWAARLVEAQLFAVTTRDPLAIAAALVSLMLVAALAALIPARRASRIDPIHALRCE